MIIVDVSAAFQVLKPVIVSFSVNAVHGVTFQQAKGETVRFADPSGFRAKVTQVTSREVRF